MQCPNCGTQLRDDARFCSECGTKLYAEDGKQPTVQPQNGGNSRDLIDVPLNDEIANMLLRAQKIIHEAEYHHVNYVNAQFQYNMTKSSSDLGTAIGVCFFGFLSICFVLVSLIYYTGLPTGKSVFTIKDFFGYIILDLFAIVPLIAIIRHSAHRGDYIRQEEERERQIFEDNLLFLEFLPPEFRTVGRIDYIVNQMQYKRCNTLREAFNMCENAHIF